MKVQKQRETLRSAAGGVPHISDMRIVLLGYRAAGKSSSGNTILGRKEFGASGRAAECVKREGETAGRHITVVEAPGWWTTVESTPEHDKRETFLSVSLCPPGPHALLLVINVDVSLPELWRRGVQQHMELLGERVWSHTIVLFTRGDLLGDTTIEQLIESEGEALQWVVEKCGNRYHVVDNMKSNGGQVSELLEKIEEMVMRNSGECSRNYPPNFNEVLPDDCSAGDSAYGSTKPTAEPELMKTFKQLSTAASTQSSGIGSADTGERSGSGETGERSGSAEKPSPIIPPIRVNTNGATAGQWKTPSRPTHGKTLTAKSKGYPVTNPFVDETTIAVDYTACIGHGSYGTVHMGSYQGTPAAIKIIPTGDNPVTTNEFTIPGRLSHPNVVRMMAVLAKSETQILIANEYIHGANLQQVLHTDTPIKLQPEDKLFVALDIALAVEYIHGRNVIHQDLKPANIMIAADNKKAYLTDWGLANLMDTISMARGSSQAGAHCAPLGGTPPYMAPECLVDCEDCSTMSDMWSLGITLLEMFTNSKAWSYSNPRELRKLLYNQKAPRALSKLQPALHGIVKPLIEYEPKSRMNGKDLVVLLKSKVDVTKRYGFKW